MDNTQKQLNDINKLNSLDDLYASLKQNSITASTKYDWIVDGGEIEITAKLDLEPSPSVDKLYEAVNGKLELNEYMRNMAIVNAKQDLESNGKKAYLGIKDSDYLKKLEEIDKAYNLTLLPIAKKSALAYINERLQTLNFPRNYDEYAQSAAIAQLGPLGYDYSNVENIVDDYYTKLSANKSQGGKLRKEHSKYITATINEVKDLLKIRHQVEDKESTSAPKVAPAAEAPKANAQQVQQAAPQVQNVVPETNKTTNNKNTKTKNTKNKTKAEELREQVAAITTTPTQAQEPAATPEKTEEKPAATTVLDQPEQRKPTVAWKSFNPEFGSAYYQYLKDPATFKSEYKKATAEEKEAWDQDLIEHIDKIALIPLCDMLKDLKRILKPSSEVYTSIITRLIENDTDEGMYSAYLLNNKYEIADPELKQLAETNAKKWKEANPVEPSKLNKIVTYVGNLFKPSNKKKEEAPYKDEFETNEQKVIEKALEKDNVPAEVTENKQQVPENLQKEFETEDTAKDSGFQFFPDNKKPTSVAQDDDAKYEEMVGILEAVGITDDTVKQFLKYKQQKDNGYFQVLYKEIKEHPKTAILDLTDLIKSTNWKPEQANTDVVKEDKAEVPATPAAVNDEDILKIFRSKYHNQFAQYPDDLVLYVLKRPEVTDEEKQKFMASINKADNEVNNADIKTIYEFITDIATFLGNILPKYQAKKTKNRENDPEWEKYHQENQQRMNQAQAKQQLEQELSALVDEGTSVTDAEKKAVLYVLHNSSVAQLQKVKELTETNSPDDIIQNVLLKLYKERELANAKQANNVNNTQASKASLLFVQANFCKKN